METFCLCRDGVFALGEGVGAFPVNVVTEVNEWSVSDSVKGGLDDGGK